jgi:hypothetical protein
MGRSAGVAQLVERNLAKVEVASSRLVSRSRLLQGKLRFPFFLGRIWRSPPLAGWQSGHAAACKAVYAGSIPTPASTFCYSFKHLGIRQLSARYANGRH